MCYQLWAARDPVTSVWEELTVLKVPKGGVRECSRLLWVAEVPGWRRLAKCWDCGKVKGIGRSEWDGASVGDKGT